MPSGSPPVTVAERIPFVAATFNPLKNAKAVGVVTVVEVSESIASITTCEWPVIEVSAQLIKVGDE